jgi:hypothetical protein
MRFNSPISASSLAIAVLFLTGAVASAQDASINFTDCQNLGTEGATGAVGKTVWTSSSKGCAASGSKALPGSAQQFNSWDDSNSKFTVIPQSLSADTSTATWKWAPAIGDPGAPPVSNPGIEIVNTGTAENGGATGTVLVTSDSGAWFQLTSVDIGEQTNAFVPAKNGAHPALAVPVTYTILFCSDATGCTDGGAGYVNEWTGTLPTTNITGTTFFTLADPDSADSVRSIEIMLDAPGGGNVYLDNIDIHVPEGAGLYMLALCGLGLAGAFFFKGRQAGLFVKR